MEEDCRLASDPVKRALVAAAIAWLAACDSKPPAAPPKQATVTAPIKESELTSIRLTPEAEQRLGITTVAVDRKPVARTRVIGGEVAPPAGALVSITAPMAGVLQAPSGMPAPGAAISRAQLLFRLVPLAAAERDFPLVAQQAIDTATARREAAARKTGRAELLLKEGAGSRRQLEEAQAELAVADAELNAARGRRAQAAGSGVTDAGVRLEAPQSGVVQAVHVKPGQTVAAGAPLIDIVQLATVWVRVQVYAGESSEIEPGAPARVLTLSESPDADGLPALPIPAPPSANPATAGVDLYYSMTNAGQRFRPGERVAVRLTRRDSTTGVVVPKAALLHDAYGGTWVYVAREPQVYARVRVVVTDIIGPSALLAQGPPPGARVVTDGAAELFGVEFGAGK